MKRILIGAVLILLLVPGVALAQAELTGRLTGVVEDPAGAVIPGASVTATHAATNTVYRATTNEAGGFVIPGLRLGRYHVAIEFQGFRRGVVQDVLVEVGTTAELLVTLQVGSVAEEVVVTADAAQNIINTVDAEIATVVDERRVLELPLNGRNASHLILLQAGVYFERTPTGEGAVFLASGQRHRSTNITLDGIDVQDNLNRASSVMLDQPLQNLAAENVQEFKIGTGNSSTEYSRGGIQVSAVTRSGSNEWHGSLFWFHRNDYFSANNFFNNQVGEGVPVLKRHQFGGRVGGPIIRNKTFFFFGYEQTRESRGIPVNRLVYTSEARQGLFRYLDNLRTTPENVAANPGLVRSVNLLECGANVQATLGRDCVDSRFDLASSAVSGGQVTLDPFFANTVFPTIPLPNNFDLGDGLNTGGFRFNSDSTTRQHLPAFRLDHIFNEKHAFFGTINYTDRDILGDFINERERIFPALEPLGSRPTHTRTFGAGLTSTFKPTLTNEFRFGVISGENAFIRNQPYDTPEFTLQINEITDPYSVGGGDSARDNETWHLRDSVSWVKGRHQLKFGGEWRHRWLDNYTFFETHPFGELHFDDNQNDPGFSETNLRNMSTGGAATDIEAPDLEAARDTINDLVGALGIIEATYNVTSLDSGFIPTAPERRKYRNRELDLFVNDTWQIHPRLTFNLGLRWEYSTVPFETQGLLLLPEGGGDAVFGVSGPAGFFNPGVFEGRPCDFLNTLPVTATTANVLAMVDNCATRFVPGGSNNGLPLWDDDYNNFAPLLSIAWDPWGDGKTSIRAGYRISYIQDVFSIVDGNVDDNEGLNVSEDCIMPDGNCQLVLAAPFLLRDVVDSNGDPIVSTPPTGAPPLFQLPTVRSFITNSESQDFRAFDKDLETAYYQEWNFSISREFWKDNVLEVRYVGNRGIGLRRVADFNEINIFALDPVRNTTFLNAFLIAQANLACNQALGVDNFRDLGNSADPACQALPNAALLGPNPLMDDLIGFGVIPSSEVTRIAIDDAMITALLFNEPGDFIDDYLTDSTSRPASGEDRIRGGAFWGQVLRGRFPVNFFQVNPFVASSRRMVNDGFSTYHALQIEFRRRFSAGLTFQANYTFNRAIADFDGNENTLINDIRPSSVRNNRYQVRDIMPRHLVNANWLYELPLGPGKPFAPDHPVARKLLEGWQTGGIIRWRSGRPLSITSGLGTFHRAAVSNDNTVNLSQPLTDSELRGITGRFEIGGGTFWIDPCMSVIIGASCTDPDAIPGLFQLPNPGELGQLSHTPIFGPKLFNFDFSLSKRTKITESTDVEFRWEVFNLTNTPGFNNPTTDIFSTSFGQILSTITEARVMQFAFKINF